MALQTVAQKLKLVEDQFDAPAMHDAADELGARLGQLSAVLTAGTKAQLQGDTQRDFMFACLRLSEACEGILRKMPLPPL